MTSPLVLLLLYLQAHASVRPILFSLFWLVNINIIVKKSPEVSSFSKLPYWELNTECYLILLTIIASYRCQCYPLKYIFILTVKDLLLSLIASFSLEKLPKCYFFHTNLLYWIFLHTNRFCTVSYYKNFPTRISADLRPLPFLSSGSSQLKEDRSDIFNNFPPPPFLRISECIWELTFYFLWKPAIYDFMSMGWNQE